MLVQELNELVALIANIGAIVGGVIGGLLALALLAGLGYYLYKKKAKANRSALDDRMVCYFSSSTRLLYGLTRLFPPSSTPRTRPTTR